VGLMRVPQPRQLDMRTSRDTSAENSRFQTLYQECRYSKLYKLVNMGGNCFPGSQIHRASATSCKLLQMNKAGGLPTYAH
jgi:hypothetical protein